MLTAGAWDRTSDRPVKEQLALLPEPQLAQLVLR